MHYLRLEEFMPYAPDEIGQRVRANHNSEDCSGDSNSMTVERKDDGVYAKCFRCGKFGRHIEAKPRHFFAKEKGVGSRGSSMGIPQMPDDSEGDVRAWPSKARLWIRQARVTDKEVKEYGINYSPRLGRVILPVYRDGKLVGYQARKIFESDEGPKYYTRTATPDRMVFLVDSSSNPDSIVLCEDVLSAIRVGRIMPAGAILGTEASDYAISLLTEGRKHGIIYLDYDNKIVISKSIKLKNKLELLLDDVLLINNSIDPKSLTDKELEDILL